MAGDVKVQQLEESLIVKINQWFSTCSDLGLIINPHLALCNPVRGGARGEQGVEPMDQEVVPHCIWEKHTEDTHYTFNPA